MRTGKRFPLFLSAKIPAAHLIFSDPVVYIVEGREKLVSGITGVAATAGRAHDHYRLSFTKGDTRGMGVPSSCCSSQSYTYNFPVCVWCSSILPHLTSDVFLFSWKQTPRLEYGKALYVSCFADGDAAGSRCS